VATTGRRKGGLHLPPSARQRQGTPEDSALMVLCLTQRRTAPTTAWNRSPCGTIWRTYGSYLLDESIQGSTLRQVASAVPGVIDRLH